MSTPAPKRVENGEDLYIPENLEELLVQFYQKTNPENAGNIPTILSKYHGKERILFNKLLNKYHEDPWPRTKPVEVKTETHSSVEQKEEEHETHIPSRDTILYHLNKKVDELSSNLLKSEAVIEKQTQELKAKNEMIDKACQNIEDLSLSLEKEKKDNATIQRQLKENASQITSLKKELQEKSSLLETMKEENKKQSIEMESLRKTQSSTIKPEEVKKMENEIASLQEANTDLKNQLTTKQNCMKSIMSKEYQQLREKMDELEKQRDDLDRVNSDLSLQNQRLEHELERTRLQVSKEQSSNENMNLYEIMKQNEALEIEIVNGKKQFEMKENEYQSSLTEKETFLSQVLTEKEELVNQLSTVQEERDTVLAENVELKKKVEEVETWIEEERQRNEILQKEMEEKMQFASDVEEERNVLQSAMKEVQQELKELNEQYKNLQEKCDSTVKENIMLKEENEQIKRNTMEVNEQLTDSLIQKLQSIVDVSGEKQSSLPVVSAAVDSSAFTLKSFLEFVETVLSGDVMATTDLKREIVSSSVKEIQGLLLDRVVTIRHLISEGIVEKKWDPKDNVTNCHNCHSQFGLVNRKHHCRYCGQAFCSNCSKKTIVFPGSEEKKRVCDDCFIVFDRLSGYMKELGRK